MTDVGKHCWKNVRVELGDRGYDIVIGANLLEAAAELLRPYVQDRYAIVVTDSVVATKYLPRLAPSLDSVSGKWNTCLVPVGEKTKSFAELQNLLERLLDAGADRETLVIAFGGGVVGDVAGLAASLLMRGIDFIQIPTTMMSQVDSSVGGKNAINTRHSKNLVGTFHQPRLVLNDVGTLATLSQREMRAGYAEMVKYGLLRGEQQFTWLEQHSAEILSQEPAALIEAVRFGCETKAHIVTIDERDRGDRAFVNLGHTFAHAIESEYGFGQLLHGEAVAAGLAAAAALSNRSGYCDTSLVDRVRQHLKTVGLPDRVSALPGTFSGDPKALFERMAYDKKTLSGRIHFVLLRDLGCPVVANDIPAETVLDVLSDEIQA